MIPTLRHAILAAAVVALSAPGAFAGERTVVELFTSQGCSSCPPADALMGELVERDDLVALSLPVDYWDFLGWKDTLASPSNSARQHAYARERGDTQVYTPQMVVGGVTHVVGSRRGAIDKAIREVAASQETARIGVAIQETADTVTVDIDGTGPADADTDAATVWVILYARSRSVEIGRGENSGRTVTYYNVVREMMPIGMWHGAPATFTLPKHDLAGDGDLGCAVLVQLHGTGPILGAAVLDPLAVAGR